MIKAYAAREAGGELTPYEFEPQPLSHHDVAIAVEYCGLCHSDYSMWKNEWDLTQFPFVGGHEVIGTVSEIGDAVRGLAKGDRVGLGWQAGYCNHCDQCLGGDQNLCPDVQPTIIGKHGGFADYVIAQDTSVIKIPEGLDPADAGPLLCAGITVFNPLVQFGIKPTDKVAVVGIGGLGHLALQFARAWGCEVTAFTSLAKMDEAKELGAHHCVDSRDPAALEDVKSRFDLILSTVDVKLDWNRYVAALKPKGRLHFLGIVGAPLDIAAMPVILSQNSVSGSPVGAPATIREMLEFAALHSIAPVTERFPMRDINEAFARLESGRARFRIVLEA